MNNWEKKLDDLIDSLPRRVGETPRKVLKDFFRSVLTQKAEEIEKEIKNHICRFNDGGQICKCFDSALTRAIEIIRR